MRDFIVRQPARIVFRRGCVTSSGAQEIRDLGCQRVVIVGTRRSLSTAEAVQLKADLGLLVVSQVNDVPAHWDDAVVEAVAERVVNEWHADAVLVFGGGTPLGLAKALIPRVAHVASATGQLRQPLLKLVCVPTTYSGSEVTAIYAKPLQLPDGRMMKVAERDERVRPALVLYDSSLLRSLPRHTAIPSIFNAVAHSVEALWAQRRGPLSSLGAMESLEVLLNGLPRLAMSVEPDERAVDDLLYGAYLAGVSLDQEDMALQHRLAHVLGKMDHLPHAETHMTILPHVVAYNQAALDPDVAAQLRTHDLATKLYDLQCQILGSPPSLRSLGFSEEHIDSVLDTLLTLNFANPVPLERERLRELLRCATAGLRPPDPPMPEFTSCTSIVSALAHLKDCPDARLKEVLTQVIFHSHSAIKAAGVTDKEWNEGIAFLTKVGHMCNSRRQEFVLLSDVLGISSLVEALDQERVLRPGGTMSTLLGPFHTAGSKLVPNGSKLYDGPLAPGQRLLRVSGRVLSTQDKSPVAGAVLDVWHSDDQGLYNVQPGFRQEKSLLGFRAKIQPDGDGSWSFETLPMLFYPVPNDGPVGALLEAMKHHPYRPAHVHFIITARGFRPLVTTLYPEDGSPYVRDDVVFGVRPELIKPLERADNGDGLSLAMHHDFFITPDADFADLDPASYIPKGSASNFTTDEEREQGLAAEDKRSYESPRVPYLNDHEFVTKDREAAESILERRKGKLLNLDRMLMHSPAVARGWNALFGALRSGLSINGRLRELIINRIAMVSHAYYEWYQHHPVYLEEGGTTEELDDLGRWRKSELFSHEDKAVLAYVDEMTKRVQVCDATAAAALKAVGSNQALVEVTVLVGGYNLVSRVLEALRLGPETSDNWPTMPTDEV